MDGIALKVMEKEDLPFIHELMNNPDIMSFWFEEAYKSMTHLAEIYEKQDGNPDGRNFILKNNNERAGFVQLAYIDYTHRNAEFTIMIDPNCQGKGYAGKATKMAMDYAFTVLNLHKLYLYVDEVNEKAIHIYKKAGFQTEAVLKGEFFANGTYRNAVRMCIFQEEYPRLKGDK